MRKSKANYRDMWDALSFEKPKTGLEIIDEIHKSGRRIVPSFRGGMYIYLSEWEDRGFIESRERTESPIPETREYIKIAEDMPPTTLFGLFFRDYREARKKIKAAKEESIRQDR